MSMDEYTGEIKTNLFNYTIPKANDKGLSTSAVQTTLFSSPLTCVEKQYNMPMGRIASTTDNSLSSLNVKKPKKRKFHGTRPIIRPTFEPYTEGLPKELIKLLLPLKCELCNAVMNSCIDSKLHYASKNHNRKINSWLINWSNETGEPIPKREQPDKGDAVSLHCKICDLELSSEAHARDHYRGKKHNAAVAGRAKPGGPGHYDAQGKWIREHKFREDGTGRFGNGPAITNTPDESTYCNDCKIYVTTASAMQAHLKGSKHIKKLKSLGITPAPMTKDLNDSILSSLKETPMEADLSIYRTPTGNYYCKTCDITVTAKILIKHHIRSKKHIAKLINVKPMNTNNDTLKIA